ncbi:MAG TPA: metallopeptidase TldD-related protein [Thermoanaerobaculia bacterium]|nr:metallopeptidase TldD-related protein [Thermoanaerobaculia bacterium]HQN08457.1 metallopeptidase TldD-related protein [Thermoanaerobaculia bacterium]HQP87424.1 metallopeptidase TldD-related protein [Thermoanaerobaculia bacterium]
MREPSELARDADDAVRLVSGLLRRGETGEAFRERVRTESWSATESGLLAPALSVESGTAVRIRREGRLLLVARSGAGPEALRDAVREAGRLAGNAPFFKAHRSSGTSPAERAVERAEAEEEGRSAALAAALARAFPDPRGISATLQLSRIVTERTVVTPRALLPCGARTRLVAAGTIRRSGAERPFSFQSARPFAEAANALALALHEATRPVPGLPPPPGPVDVVFSPSAASVFWHEVVGHSLEADGGERGSVLSRVKGAAVAPPGLDVHDDPGRADLPGAYGVDDEGTLARAIPLLADGVVTGLLADRRSGGVESNGHGRTASFRRPPRARMSNLVANAGHASFGELIERCGDGVLVKEVATGSADPESGRFVLLVSAAEAIRRGRRSAPLTPFALGGEILSALGAIEDVWGNEVLPATGLSICVKGGDAVPVGGAAAALLVRGLVARTARR